MSDSYLTDAVNPWGRAQLLQQFGHVYRCIEECLAANRADPHLQPLQPFLDKLRRSQAFLADVRAPPMHVPFASATLGGSFGVAGTCMGVHLGHILVGTMLLP